MDSYLLHLNFILYGVWRMKCYIPTHQLKSTKISAFYKFNRYKANVRKCLERKWKCKYLITSTLPILFVPCLFARLEKCSLECIIPLDTNEFLFVRYMF